MLRSPSARFGGLSLVALATLAFTSAASAQTGAFAVRHVRVFDGAKVIENGAVLVVGGKIASVGPDARLRLPAGARVIEGAGKTLMPGLIEAHAHVVDSYKANGAIALEEATAYGITTVIDLATANPVDYVAFRKAVKAGDYPNGADLFTAGPGADTKQLREPAQAQAWVDAHKAGGADVIKIFAYAPTERGGPDAALKPETEQALIAAAHKDGLMAVSHSLNEPISRQMAADGLDGLVHLSSDPNSVDFGKVLAKEGVFQSTNIIGVAPLEYRVELANDPTLSAFMPGFMVEGLKAPREPRPAYAVQIANFKAIKAAGVLTAAGTDGFYPYPPLLHAELRILVKDAGVAPVEALMMATSNPAKAYKLTDRGVIAAGKRADLLLVDGDPTKDILATRRIDTVWIAGRMIDRVALKAKVTGIAAPAPRPAPAPAPAR